MKIMIEPRMPNVNLNGTARLVLVDQQVAVAEAAKALLKALEEASPHGRDWQQTKDQGVAYWKARAAHEELMQTAQAITDQARCLAKAISLHM